MPHWHALRFLRDHEAIAKSRNRLPHWQQEDTCCFITFRLADSLPEHLLANWREDRAIWLNLHPKPWTMEVEKDYDERFTKKIDRWLDRGHGCCVLKHEAASATVTNTLSFFDGDRYVIHSFVIMPNHVHVLASMSAEHPLGKIVQSWKSFSSRAINAELERKQPLWQKDYFDRLVRDEEHFMNVWRYIAGHVRENPAAVLYQAPWHEE